MLKRIRALLGGGKKNGLAGNERPDPDETVSRTDSVRPAVHHGPRVVHRPIERHLLDADAVKIVQRLTRFEHTAYLVGGCVRDVLLERKPKDFDIGTSATPRQIKRVFRNCRIIGRRFRLAHIYFQDGKIIEVATFRALDEPAPEAAGDETRDLLIRDDNVFGTPEEDALRRDFTINQLFYDLTDDTVIDHAGGLDDLRRRLVRTIGEPEIRFREDPIRSLRAIKFAARLDFGIEKATLAAIQQTRQELHKAAPPRILEELNRFCRGGAARRSFELMKETEILGVVLPEVAEGCEKQPHAWSLLIDLLRHMDDQRVETQREIRTGEIFACLLLPILTDTVGWKEGEAPPPMRAMDARELVERHLRPMALRLRVPRREQEYCRQILTTLFRMVPARRIRPNTRRSIVGRQSFHDAMWMLEIASEQYRDAFVEALDFWKNAAESDAGAASTDAATTTEAKPEGDAPRRSRRRRRSRRGRGSGDGEAKSDDTEREKQSEPRKPRARRSAPRKAESQRPPERRPDMPPPWDDNYFFAALPSAHDEETEDIVVEPVTEAAEPAPVEQAEARDGDAPEAQPRRRRRRRRRRRKTTSDDGSNTDDGETPEPADS